MKRLLFPVLALLTLFAHGDEPASACLKKLVTLAPWRAELRLEWTADRPDLKLFVAFDPPRFFFEIEDGRRWWIDGDRCYFSSGTESLLLDAGPFLSALRKSAEELVSGFPEESAAKVIASIPRCIPTVEMRFNRGDSLAVSFGAGISLESGERVLKASWIEDLSGAVGPVVAGLFMRRDEKSFLAVKEETGFLHELTALSDGKRAGRIKTLRFIQGREGLVIPPLPSAPDTLQLPGRMRVRSLQPFFEEAQRQILRQCYPQDEAGLAAIRSLWVPLFDDIFRVTFSPRLVRYAVERSLARLRPELERVLKTVPEAKRDSARPDCVRLVADLSRKYLLGEARTISVTAEEALDVVFSELAISRKVRKELLGAQVEILFNSMQNRALQPVEIESARAIDELFADLEK